MKYRIFLLLNLFLLTSRFAVSQTAIDSLSNYPNPFCNDAIIHFDIVNSDTVTLKVISINGTTVNTFFNNTILASGSYSINWFGGSLPADMYLIQMHYGANITLSNSAVKQCSPTSIQDVINDEKLMLFPNPASDFITIPIEGIKNISILNLNGQICQSIKTDSQTIAVSDFPSGIYIMKVLLNDGSVKVRKFIKQ